MSATATTAKPASAIQIIRERLRQSEEHFETLLPENSQVTAAEVVTGALKMISESTQQSDPRRRLDNCTPSSILLAVSEAASLGLVPGIGGDGWLIGRNNNKAGHREPERIVRECNWMTGIGGIIRLVYMNPNVARILCDVVHKEDTFEWVAGDAPKCTHIHARLRDRGEVECAYFLVTYQNGTVQGEKMDFGDLEMARSKSHQSDSGPWKDWRKQMQRKTVGHRARKWLPFSPKIRAVLDRELKREEQLQEIGDELVEAHARKGVGFEEII